MKTTLLFRRNPVYYPCPSCKASNSLHRSRARNWKEIIVKRLTLYKHYRCNKCGWRGTMSTLVLTTQSIKNLFFYLMLAGISGFIVLQVIKRFIK